MLTPLSRLKAVAESNPRAAAVTVHAGDLADVCAECDPKHPAVKSLSGPALEAERPGVELRVPLQALSELIGLAAKR